MRQKCRTNKGVNGMVLALTRAVRDANQRVQVVGGRQGLNVLRGSQKIIAGLQREFV